MNSVDYEALGRFIEQVDAIDGSTSVYKAIKFFKAAYSGMVEDAFYASSGRMIPTSVSSTFDSQKKISAIKELRVFRVQNSMPGDGLKDCKDDVDEYFQKVFR